MKLLQYLVLIELAIACSADHLLATYGTRTAHDRLLAKYTEKQTNPDGGLEFRFEHPMNGKYFTSWKLETVTPSVGNLWYTLPDSRLIAATTLNFTTATEQEVTFSVYGTDYSPGPVYP